MDQATAADGRVVDRARAWCSMIGIPYFRYVNLLFYQCHRYAQFSHIKSCCFPVEFRFNPQMSEDIAMDEKHDIKLIKMLFEAKAYMYKNRQKVVEMINFVK